MDEEDTDLTMSTQHKYMAKFLGMTAGFIVTHLVEKAYQNWYNKNHQDDPQ